jgi:hypothetical protein
VIPLHRQNRIAQNCPAFVAGGLARPNLRRGRNDFVIDFSFPCATPISDGWPIFHCRKPAFPAQSRICRTEDLLPSQAGTTSNALRASRLAVTTCESIRSDCGSTPSANPCGRSGDDFCSNAASQCARELRALGILACPARGCSWREGSRATTFRRSRGRDSSSQLGLATGSGPRCFTGSG